MSVMISLVDPRTAESGWEDFIARRCNGTANLC